MIDQIQGIFQCTPYFSSRLMYASGSNTFIHHNLKIQPTPRTDYKQLIAIQL